VPEWILPTTITALAAVVGYMGRTIIARLDSLEALMRTEMRTMDVRISRIEEHLWPRK
jgi:hypothetical protein